MKISFPHLASYSVPIERLLKNLFKEQEIIVPPPFTRRTIELGAKLSPDFVCMPFKYNLGNFIEAAELGATLLFQGSGGCRYSYYTELQGDILKEMGYNARVVNLFEKDLGARGIYERLKENGCKVSFFTFAYYALLAVKTIRVMDKIDFFIRENIGFEMVEGSFEDVRMRFLNALKDVTSFSRLEKVRKKFYKEFYSLRVEKNSDTLRVGIIGELYSLMEPFSNFFMEKELAKNNISVKRYTNVTYLLFKKKRFEKKIRSKSQGILQYKIGADGAESVIHLLELSNQGYDGIIHLKPFGCTPEINAIPILMKTAEELNFPVIYLSFDQQSSETGVKTRLEAFYDMLKMRREIKKQISKTPEKQLK